MNEPDGYEFRLIAAYERMMERVRAAAEEADLELRPKLAWLLETAQDKAVELGELSREEAERIGDYLRRDIEDAAGFLAGEKIGEKGGELMDWLRLDIDIVEKRLLELFAGVADRTRLELLALEEQRAPPGLSQRRNPVSVRWAAAAAGTICASMRRRGSALPAVRWHGIHAQRS